MPLSIATFQNEIASLGNIYRAMGYANDTESELNLVATALKHGSDDLRHDHSDRAGHF